MRFIPTCFSVVAPERCSYTMKLYIVLVPKNQNHCFPNGVLRNPWVPVAKIMVSWKSPLQNRHNNLSTVTMNFLQTSLKIIHFCPTIHSLNFSVLLQYYNKYNNHILKTSKSYKSANVQNFDVQFNSRHPSPVRVIGSLYAAIKPKYKNINAAPDTRIPVSKSNKTE